MSEPVEPATAGRGAQRRRALHERRLQTEALRWWLRPGVLVFLAAVLLAGSGWALLIRATRRLPVREATVDGLRLAFGDANWIADQMEHGTNFQQPASMMPDLPAQGKQRVTAYMTLTNVAGATRNFHGEELYLVPEIGEKLPSIGAVVGEAQLQPGQSLNTALHFDLDTTRPHGKLLLSWQPPGHRAFYFAIPDPPEHYHLRPRGGDQTLPQDARLLLPIANATRGEQLFKGTYACSACHGDPEVPGSNNLGPHLGGIGGLAQQRVPDKPAAQYIYESILQPDAFIAPECKGGAPCQRPSAMPEYSTLVTLQDAADLVGYLLEQRTAPSSRLPERSR